MKKTIFVVCALATLGFVTTGCSDNVKTDERAQFPSWEQNEQNAKEKCLAEEEVVVVEPDSDLPPVPPSTTNVPVPPNASDGF